MPALSVGIRNHRPPNYLPRSLRRRRNYHLPRSLSRLRKQVRPLNH
jgi:hypothetical protein